tara:strand:+ start:91 stop:897 length:807 start_codon:yes stop_codon:yes gene_type:complete
MYCLSLSNSHLKKIQNINYTPVGLGNDNFDKQWIRDNTNDHISKKNSFYGENTFHYWLWKNDLQNVFNKDWVGFCHYRRFWLKDSIKKEFKNLKQSIIQYPSNLWKNYEIVLGDELYVNKTKISKILKHGKRQLLKNPIVFLSKDKMTIKVHFDMYHGFGNLDKAIDLLNKEDREDFRNFVNTKISFNPFNMFICKSHKLLNDYYNSLFPWLEKCESLFGFQADQKYGLIRMYGFLAERYLSYWFKKNSNYILWPIQYYDISNEQLNL